MQMQIIIVIFLMVNKISENLTTPNILPDGILVLQFHITNWDNHNTKMKKYIHNN